MELYAAFLLGLTGSLHCVGMCGPLMLATSNGKGLSRLLAYQSGRILIYTILGVLLGAIGLGARLWNAQSGIAISSGMLLIAFAFYRLDPARMVQAIPGYAHFQVGLRAQMGRLLPQSGLVAGFAVGCCNGLLPCGLVYLAVIGAANAPSPMAGAMFMVAFGVGTLPLLLVTLLAGRRLLRLDAGRLASITPLVMTVAGLLLLYRGFEARLPADFFSFQDQFFPPMCH